MMLSSHSAVVLRMISDIRAVPGTGPWDWKSFGARNLPKNPGESSTGDRVAIEEIRWLQERTNGCGSYARTSLRFELPSNGTVRMETCARMRLPFCERGLSITLYPSLYSQVAGTG
jgi:hypothetical protein